MDILLKPDSLCLSGSMNHFVISTNNEITFVLKYADTGTTIVQHTYIPNKSNRIEVDLESIITPLLSFRLQDISDVYKQPSIVRQFTAQITEVGTSNTEAWTFSVLRAGIDHFSDSAANWLKANFLTWQPTVKPVTYYTPEFLTYYAVVDSVVRCRAYVDKNGEYASYDLTLANLSNGSVWTIPVQYAIISGKLNKLPSYYDVWVETKTGTRLTYLQRYYATDIRSEQEQWVLFENSLGGIDTFRAYGDSENTAKHTHNIAEIENEAEEYRVDTTREYKKNTGFLSEGERRWLLDFFPSLGKYLYIDSYIRRIVVTESDASWQTKELPSSYTFTYKYADARPYLNISRTEQPTETLNIKVPDVGSFTVAPRLVEFDRLSLSGGALFPVQNPYSDKWSVTTAAAFLDFLAHEITAAYKGDGSFGHSHGNMSLLDSLTIFGKYLLVNAQKIAAGEADFATLAANLDPKSSDWDKILRKDRNDTTQHSLGVGGDLTVEGSLGGKDFVHGMDGAGWRLWLQNELANLELDNLTVRQTMRIFELLIDHVRSVGGQMVVSAANGKVYSVKEEGDDILLSFEVGCEFESGDFIRCQTFNGNGLKHYWVQVKEVRTMDDGQVFAVVSKNDIGWFSGTAAAGDECVLFGSDKDGRQGLILISATDDGQPRIDILNGIHERNLNDGLRTRLGSLDGIRDDAFPEDNQPHGYGLYSNNAYLRGDFILRTGININTWVSIVEGKVRSEIDSMRSDFIVGKGFLSNSLFLDGLNKWKTENNTTFFTIGGKWIWANNNVYSWKGDSAVVGADRGRTVMKIRNKYIVQKNADFTAHPKFEKDKDGKTIPQPIYLTFYYRVVKPGKLTAGFVDTDITTTQDNYEQLTVSEDLSVTEGYEQYKAVGQWNGTGDFKLSFTGEIYVYMLILTQREIDDLEYKYRTLFEQTDRLIQLTAGIYGKDPAALKVLRESGLVIEPEGSGIFAKDADGKVGFIGVSVQEVDTDGNTKTVIKLTADNIKLEGLVTANGNFKILEDGSIETLNGKFKGEIEATKGHIGRFSISQDHIGIDSAVRDSEGKITFKEDYNGLFLYDQMIGFNAKDRQAILGTWNNFGIPILCQLTDTKKEFLSKYGLVVNVSGSQFDNVAIDMEGGHIQGMAIKTEIYGFENITKKDRPTAPVSVTLKHGVGAVLATTQFYWREKATDDAGREIEYATVTRDRNIILPEVHGCDDGHMVWIKRGSNNGSAVNIKPGVFYRPITSSTGFYNTEFSEEKRSTYMIIDNDAEVFDQVTLQSEGDAMCFVFFAGLHVKRKESDGSYKDYYGAWVQWKNPRDW